MIDLGVSKKFKRYLGNEFRDVDMWTRTGTEFYTAPEIYQGGGYNEKVDLWSVGVTLYLVLAGELPFHGDTHSATIELILAGKFNLDHENFSRLVRDLLRRLLNPNPMSRLSATSKKVINFSGAAAPVVLLVEKIRPYFSEQRPEVAAPAG